jgi:hypothetical protein
MSMGKVTGKCRTSGTAEFAPILNVLWPEHVLIGRSPCQVWTDATIESRGVGESEKRLTRSTHDHGIDFTLKAQYLLDGLSVMEDG